MNISTTSSALTDDVIVSVEGKGIIGRIRRVGIAFQALDATGRDVIAVKYTERHALNVFKYGA